MEIQVQNTRFFLKFSTSLAIVIIQQKWGKKGERGFIRETSEGKGRMTIWSKRETTKRGN